MDKIIELLENEIKKILDNRELLTNELEQFKETIKILNNSKTNPDEIDVETFKSIFNSDLSSKLDDLLLYKGWFKSNSEESQIELALNELSSIINSKIEELNNRIESINSIINSDELINAYTEALNILKKSDNGQYISMEELSKLDKVVESIGYTDDLVNAYLKIAMNNSAIEKTKKVSSKVELSDDQIRRMDDALDRINFTEENIKEKKSDNDRFAEMFNKFNNIENGNSPSYKDVKEMLDDDLYNTSKEIISKSREIMSDLDFKPYQELLNEFGLEIFDGEDLYIGMTIELLSAYESKNIERIKELIKILKDKEAEEERTRREQELRDAEFEREFEQALLVEETANSEPQIDDIIPASGLEEYAEKLKEVNDRYGISKFLQNNENYISSFGGLNLKDIKDSFPPEEDYYKYCIALVYDKIFKILITGNNSDEIKHTLSELKVELDSAINSFEDYLLALDNINEKTIYEQMKEEGKPFNYLVIFDKDEFDDTYSKSRAVGAIKKTEYPAAVLRSLNEIMMTTDLSQIMRKSHNIHRSHGHPNEDELLDYAAGKMRITIKILPNPHVIGDDENDKHNVIIVFHNVYALRDKSDELMATITTFDTKQDRFKQIQEIFSENGTKEDQEREFQLSSYIYKRQVKRTEGGMVL